MRLILKRTHAVGDKTFGTLSVDGRRICYTLEDTVREVPGQPVQAWKVRGLTAIPRGEYRVTLENSPRFGLGTLTINDVPGFAGVRMHAGNTAQDTEGCPLLGMAINDAGIVGGTSRPAVAAVKAVVEIALRQGEPVSISIS